MLAVAGNWRKFESFIWYDKPQGAAEFAVVYTHNRDSDSVTRANAATIDEILAPYVETGDAIAETHNHCLVGWVAGYALKGAAIGAYNEILERLEDCTVLDEDKLGEIENEDEAQAWEGCYRREFENAIEKRAETEIGAHCVITFQPDELDSLWEGACQKLNWCWQHSGEGPKANIGAAVELVELDSLTYWPIGLRIYRNGQHITGATIEGRTYSADCMIYSDIVEAAADAFLNGEKDFAIGSDYFNFDVEG